MGYSLSLSLSAFHHPAEHVDTLIFPHVNTESEVVMRGSVDSSQVDAGSKKCHFISTVDQVIPQKKKKRQT